MKDAVAGLSRSHPLELAAALSYYTLLSFAPLVLVTVALTGLIFGREAIQGQIVAQVRGFIGGPGAEVIETVIKHANEPAHGVVSLVVGLVTLLVGATSVFVQLQDALNRIWEVPTPDHGNAIWGVVKGRLLSLAMVLGIGFLLLVSLLIDAVLAAVAAWATSGVATLAWLLHAVDGALSLAVVTVLFAMIFKILPAVRLAWRDVWLGAAITSVLFTAGKYVIGLYIGRAGIGSVFGAAGSLVVVMVWTYYASLIVFFGAAVTRARTRRTSLVAGADAARPR